MGPRCVYRVLRVAEPVLNDCFQRGKVTIDWLNTIYTGPPTPPLNTNPTAISATNSSLTIRWLPPASIIQQPVSNYTVFVLVGGTFQPRDCLNSVGQLVTQPTQPRQRKLLSLFVRHFSVMALRVDVNLLVFPLA